MRVPIQPSVQQYGDEQTIWTEHELHVPTVCVPIHSRGQIDWKLQKLSKHLEKNELDKQ